MTKMRPIDELTDTAKVQVMRNQAMTWLRDIAGVEYAAPPWLVEIIDQVWERGYREAQSDIREAMGFVLVPREDCDACRQGSGGKKEEVASGR